jgi:hypothetical protein
MVDKLIATPTVRPLGSMPLTVEEVANSVWAMNLLDQYGLMPLWKMIQAENTSANLPYHNEQHLLNVVAWCGRLYFSDSLSLAPDQLRCLLAAAACHDILHSGGKTSDSENIGRTLEWLSNAIPRIKDDQCRSFMFNHQHLIYGLITVTEFPFIHQPKTSLQKILRDADILQNFGSHCVKYLKGLAEEFAASGMVLTNEELIARQEVFMRDVEFFTYTGQAIKAAVGNAVFAQQRDAFLKKVN